MLRTLQRRGLFGLCAGLVALTCGCVPDDRKPVPGSDDPANTGYQIGVDETLLEEGRQAYATYCVGCHGEKGDGLGKAASVLHPKPRDLTTANFKFSSRRSGELPTDEDLFGTLTNGLTGTSMPPWKLLPVRERWALVHYIKTFSDKWQRYSPAPAIPIVEDPHAVDTDKSAAIRRGEIVYHGMAQCWTCHPAYVDEATINDYHEKLELPRREFFRENLHNSVSRLSSEDQLVYVPDFKRDRLRAGNEVRTLYRSISAGITGTAMPTWVDSIEIESEKADGLVTSRGDLWALAYFVHDLTTQRPAVYAEADIVVRDRRMNTGDPNWEPEQAKLEREAAGAGSDDEEEEEEEE